MRVGTYVSIPALSIHTIPGDGGRKVCIRIMLYTLSSYTPVGRPRSSLSPSITIVGTYFHARSINREIVGIRYVPLEAQERAFSFPCQRSMVVSM